MIGYGFGYDPEVPGGFQDADIEMRELEDAAQEQREREKDEEGFLPCGDQGFFKNELK